MTFMIYVILAVMLALVAIMISMSFKLERHERELEILMRWAKDQAKPHAKVGVDGDGKLYVKGSPSNEH